MSAELKYRNIFFHTTIPHCTGHILVKYSGIMYTNAKQIKNLNDIYNPTQDLYVTCGSCAAKKYKQFLKV